MHFKKKIIYSCEVWSTSTDLISLKYWSLLLPLFRSSTGLSTKIKRFTLLRSPLGNKASKDQFERREYKSYFFFKSENSSEILALLDILRYSSGVKSKILLKTAINV
uniref:ribosomal protein S10 n=1 Tax=Colpomenia sinuosa TaxID=87236 RepID=UPI0030029355|nr:ribosomal protein S10 [Colpomenia sinuosa]